MERNVNRTSTNPTSDMQSNKSEILSQNLPEHVQVKGSHPQRNETSSRVFVLKELGNILQIKAERMRLLARVEQGLEEGDLNSFATQTLIPPATDKGFREQDKQTTSSKIPVSSARQKWRDKKKKSKKTSNVDIRQYRPGYTWNRGGRVRELKIRTLARKFLYLWMRKTFGRVSPSQASHHYKRKLLKLVFSEWHTLWWEARREWRLVVRAECHHRYVLWLKSFRAWKEFVVRRRVRKTKLALAEQHGGSKLMRKYLDAWIVYTECRRHKRQKKHTAQKHYNTQILRSAWCEWRSKQEVIHYRQHMETVALQFWAYRVQAQHWLIWQERLSQRRAAILNQFKAARHHNMVSVRKCLHGWILYWRRCTQKKQEKESVQALYKRQLVWKMLHQWFEQYRIRQAVHEHQERMKHLAEIFQLRRFFVAWQHYVQLQHEKELMIADAEGHYERKLLIAGLSGFRLCVIQRRLKIMRQDLAQQHRNKMLMLRAWNQWLARCEDNEELKIISETRRARKHYRLTLIQKCFSQLQDYCSWRKHRQSQYARAEAHYYMHVMPQYLFRMKIFVQLMKNNRENAENAVAFRRENLQASYFYTWVNMYEFSKEYRMNERMAILQYDDTVLKRFFRSWKLKTAEALKETENEETADSHYNTTLCRNHLLAWKAYIDDLKTSQRHEVVASRHYCERGLKRCFEAWKQYTAARRQKHRLTDRAMGHYNRVLCRKMVAMWLHYVDTQRVIKRQVEIKYAAKCQHLMVELFTRWRENVATLKSEREAGQHAVQHHSQQLFTKVLTAWHRYAAIHAYKKSETRQLVESAREEINNKKLRIYFTKWQIVHSETALYRLQCEKADKHHGLRIKHAVIQIWKAFTKQSIRTKLLRKQSTWFHQVRLTAQCFVLWKHAYSEAVIEKEKTNIALWHWCLSLHRKVLIGWFIYVQQRKHKKQRLADAMERRRCHLLREGVTQWLLVADDMRAMRMKFAAQQQAKSAYETSQLMLRIGLHWKHWARKQVIGRGAPKPPPSHPTATKPSSHMTQLPPSGFGFIGPSDYHSGPSLSAPVSARSEGHPHVPRSRSPVPDLRAQVSATSPARSTRSEYGRSQVRAKPRRPDFLVESLKRAGLFCPSPSTLRTEATTQALAGGIEKEMVQEGHAIEGLNLSNLSGETSEADTIPFKPTSHSEREQNLVASGATVHTSQQRTCEESNIVHHRVENVLEIVPQNLPVPQTIVPKLLTPADFMPKQKISQTSCAPSHMKDTDCDIFSAKRQAVPDYHIHSETQSVASTPRVLCQSAEHSHPLMETYTLTSGNVGEVTPRSLGDVTPKASARSSTQEIQKEIVLIRNRLKNFDQKKKKLKTMQKQLKQLSDWLKEEEVKGHNGDDEDIQNARQEISELSSDISDLKKVIEDEKILCSRLVDRVKLLTAQLSLT